MKNDYKALIADTIRKNAKTIQQEYFGDPETLRKLEAEKNAPNIKPTKKRPK